MTVSILKSEEEDDWKAFVGSSPKGTVYHTLGWREVARVFGHKPYYLISRDERGSVQGVLPLFYVKGIFGKRLVSIPLRDRGGPLFTNEEALFELLTAAEELTKELSCKYLEIKTLDGLPGKVTELGLEKTEHYITTVISLSPDTETVWKRFDRVSVRQAINKSKRKGASARWAENLDDVRKFYTLFLRTRKKLGVPPYPFALFQAVWEILDKANMAKLSLVEYNDLPIGGLIVFNFKERMIAAYMASHERYLHLNPNNLLFWATIEWACKNGYKYYDFGASSPYQKSLIAFKSRWGGSEIRLPFYFYLNTVSTMPILDSNTPSYRLFRKVWSRTPISVARTFGPFFTRQMD